MFLRGVLQHPSKISLKSVKANQCPGDPDFDIPFAGLYPESLKPKMIHCILNQFPRVAVQNLCI